MFLKDNIVSSSHGQFGRYRYLSQQLASHQNAQGMSPFSCRVHPKIKVLSGPLVGFNVDTEGTFWSHRVDAQDFNVKLSASFSDKLNR